MGAFTGVDIPPGPEYVHRPVLERVLARVPWLIGIGMAVVARLPTSSRIRRRVLVEAYSRSFAATDRGDSWYIPSAYEPDCEVIVPAEFRALGMAASYRGHAGAFEAIDALMEPFLELRWKAEHLIDLGDRWVLRARFSGSGRTSGVATDQVWGAIFRLSSRGRIARQDNYWTWDETLAAAGLDR